MMPSKNRSKISIIVLTMWMFSLQVVAASDVAKEKRWADQVVDSILDGDAVWLKTDDQEFLSIYTEVQEGSSDQALIVMHGTGVHPNWDQVILPVRVDMTFQGWNTLSIQMPVLENDAAHEDYAELFIEVIPRINAALTYLHSQGNRRIVLVGHSMGSLMTAYYLAQQQPHDAIRGFVAIGMPGAAKHAAMDSLKNLKSIQLPVLDLFGSDDLAQVLESRQAKKAAATAAGNPFYQQVQVTDANHFFDSHNAELNEVLGDWLQNLKQ